MERLAAAIRLIEHARYCCNALLDGTPGHPITDHRYWTTKLSIHPRYWTHDIITSPIVAACLELGVDIAAVTRGANSLEQLCRFMNALDAATPPVLTDNPARKHIVEVPGCIDPIRYVGTRLHMTPAAFEPETEWHDNGPDIYLHGSSADLQTTPFSDIDDFVILRRECWQSVERFEHVALRMATIARRFQDIDRLQHHGHWVVTELNLMAYDETFLPLVVLDTAVRVVGRSRVNVNVQINKSDFGKQIAISASSIDRLIGIHRHTNALRAFDLKCLAGEVMLLPAKVFQFHGEITSKPNAISRATEIFSPDAIAALEWATRVRSEFGCLVDQPLSSLTKYRLARFCPRRIHAQKVMRSASTLVTAYHSLGVSATVMAQINAMRDESLNICKGGR